MGLLHQLAQPHVGNLDVEIVLVGGDEQDVLGLEIPVADVPGVEVLHSRGQLVEDQLAHSELAGQLLGEDVLVLLVTDEHKHLLGLVREGDLRGVLQHANILL